MALMLIVPLAAVSSHTREREEPVNSQTGGANRAGLVSEGRGDDLNGGGWDRERSLAHSLTHGVKEQIAQIRHISPDDHHCRI